ncbi:MAG: CoB--CoM heterodisulfide reductase iron-sulfur subunit A family protein [Armatimonadetes bacterium]|nr:CoB--CoM heterodisulfide reductase iron-sulfur subunit A family protein [Armatimonadota bacterium]
MARTGVFVCHCGSNIAKTVDVASVAEQARELPGVVYTEDYQYMCSSPGQEHIRQAIEEHRLDSIVVASCSPRLHEPTFRRCAAEAGLNPYLVEMANIREHCSWVHKEKEIGTPKAFDLVKAAVAKVQRNVPLHTGSISITKRALVIGGGIAGIQAALDIADAGHEVILVEKTPSIGGRMAQFDKTFPTLDCSACILTPKMVEVAQNPNIKLMTWSEVEHVEGYVGNFKVTIRQKARFADLQECIGCGQCWEKCPVKKIPSEFQAGTGNRTAIYVPFPQAVPNVPVIDKEHCLYLTQGKCGVCAKVCPKQCISYEDQDKLVEVEVGAIVVATGFDVEPGKLYGEYVYGDHPDIITGLQFERLMNACGPTGGHLERPSDGREPRTVVFVKCAGSRDEVKGVPYCSKVCCMYTAKHALLIKEKYPDTKVYIFYIDVRATGKGYEEFADRTQREFGAEYIRGRVSRIYPEGDHLVVVGVDTLLGKQVEVDADLVVLATPMLAREDAKDLGRMLNIASDNYGFFTEAHPKLRPAETLTAGIYLAGACLFPRDIPDSVASGGAAAAKVNVLLARESIESEPIIAEVDEQTCVGCLNCVRVCPFKAIEEKVLENPKTGETRVVAAVNEGVCEGCGTCAAACPSKCIMLRGFTDEQILAEVDVLCV